MEDGAAHPTMPNACSSAAAPGDWQQVWSSSLHYASIAAVCVDFYDHMTGRLPAYRRDGRKHC